MAITDTIQHRGKKSEGGRDIQYVRERKGKEEEIEMRGNIPGRNEWHVTSVRAAGAR